MEGRVRELQGARCEVTFDADIRLAGKIVRFGRGMIQAVTAEIFKEFTKRLAEELAADKLRRERLNEGTGQLKAATEGEAPGASPPLANPSSEALPLFGLLLRSLRSWLRRLFGQN